MIGNSLITADASSLATKLSNVFKEIQPFVYILCAAAVVVLGVMLIAGGEKGREKAKSWAPAILIGSLCISGAVTIGKWISDTFTF
ncbi:hypothetical protein [Ruminococcus sp.]|uniref:hypothetical protein n=1 Tax=Ruminococcus sp. TaxID=41978 RepID=UPI002E821846|nr:hypothetical protein [Ruminococcus sp.]MEE3439815.1 hypothetical protein [Ruminococcus sp.]